MDTSNPLVVACSFGDIATLAAELDKQPAAVSSRHGEGSSLLHEAAIAGQTAVVRLLLERSSELTSLCDDDGQTALHHAASEGHIEVVELLAPSPDCPELFVLDKYQMTPYHLACENGREAVVTHLLTLLDEQPETFEPRASRLRRGSAMFLAQQGGHEGVIEIINSSRSNFSESSGG